MSSSGTSQITALNSSGPCVIAAPISSPPFEPPLIARCAGDVQPLDSSQRAAARKSSNTFCLASSMPALCHSSPYSPPPRRLGTATMPPCSSHIACAAHDERDHTKPGSALTLNPPSPVRYVG